MSVEDDTPKMRNSRRVQKGAVRRIVAVAIKGDVSGLIYSLPRPARHCDVLHTILDSGTMTDNPNDGQGFLTSQGEFVDRKDAKRIALDADQLKHRDDRSELYSEDLW